LERGIELTHEQELPLDYAVPATVSRAERPYWVNVTYLVLGAMAIGIAILCLLEQVHLFSWVGHLEFVAQCFACPALILFGLIFMTKGLAIFENNQQGT
jgi:hypothetical protein